MESWEAKGAQGIWKCKKNVFLTKLYNLYSTCWLIGPIAYVLSALSLIALVAVCIKDVWAYLFIESNGVAMQPAHWHTDREYVKTNKNNIVGK